MKLRAHQLLFFTSIVYGEVKPVFPSEARFLNHKNIGKEDDILLISGIAVPTPFIREAEKYSNKVLRSFFLIIIRLASQISKKLDVIFEKMTSPGKLIFSNRKRCSTFKKQSSCSGKLEEIFILSTDCNQVLQ